MSFKVDCRRIFESTNTEKKKLAERIYAKRLLDIQSGCLDTPRPEGTMLFSELATRYIEWAQRQKGIRRKEGFVKALHRFFRESTAEGLYNSTCGELSIQTPLCWQETGHTEQACGNLEAHVYQGC